MNGVFQEMVAKESGIRRSAWMATPGGV